MQIYVTRDDLGEDAYAAFKKDDLGDIIGVSGTVFCTKTGEASIHVKSLTLLCKSLKVLPEKFHGLVDTDLRYRQRYVDCIVNPEVRDTFRKRSRIIAAVREFLDGRGYLEVDTPVLHTWKSAHPRVRSARSTTRWESPCSCALRPSCT